MNFLWDWICFKTKCVSWLVRQIIISLSDHNPTSWWLKYNASLSPQTNRWKWTCDLWECCWYLRKAITIRNRKAFSTQILALRSNKGEIVELMNWLFSEKCMRLVAGKKKIRAIKWSQVFVVQILHFLSCLSNHPFCCLPPPHHCPPCCPVCDHM